MNAEQRIDAPGAAQHANISQAKSMLIEVIGTRPFTPEERDSLAQVLDAHESLAIHYLKSIEDYRQWHWRVTLCIVITAASCGFLIGRLFPA